MTQAELTFGQQQAKQRASDADCNEFMRVLREHSTVGVTWLTGKQLCETLDLPDCEASRRKFRKIAEANPRLVVTGDKGYALVSQCKPEEILHAIARLKTMGAKLLQRSVDLSNAYHQFQTERAA